MDALATRKPQTVNRLIMAVDMKIPAVGESITEVTVGTWYKQEGDAVKMDDVLCGLDSDKATFELTAEADGVLHILAQEGDVLPIGASICSINDNGSAPAKPTPACRTGSTSRFPNRRSRKLLRPNPNE